MNKINYIVIMLIIVVSGCTHVVTQSHPIYIDDTNSTLENYNSCYKACSDYCNSHYDCDAFRITKIICENGKCLCD